MAKKKAEDIKAILDHEIASAIAYDSSENEDKRRRAIEYYFGTMNDTPAMPNRSSVTSRDTSDVIGWMLPGIIRTFTASGRIVDFEPMEIDDEDAADQASDYINYVFMKENKGYRILYSATHDSLLQANGIVKQWWDDTPDTEISEHTGLDEMQLSALLMEPDVEVLTQDQTDDGMFSVKIQRTKSYGCLKYDVVEPEDFIMDKTAVSIEEARFTAHREQKTKSDLIEMGFDRKLVENLPSDRTSRFDTEDQARDQDRLSIDDAKEDANTLIELFECYAKIDVDGDGVAEMVRAYYAGNQGSGELLDWEVWEDDCPFDDIPCEPVPHRFDGRSVFDSTEDMQRVKTVLLRQMLDNLYAINNPQKEVEQGSVLNPDALVNPKFGQPIWKKKASAPIVPHDVTFIGDKALMGMEYIDQVIERRTGVSRSTMALDPEALQNQTATAVQKQQDAAYSKVELIARNMAELGWRKVFRKSLKLIVKHQDRPRMIRLRGEWTEMDPRHWNASMDCEVNVGLGTGSRDRDMAMMQTVNQQQMLMAKMFADYGAPQGAIEFLDKILKTSVKMAESAGLKNADDYYPAFGEKEKAMLLKMVEQASQQKDPKIELEQMKFEHSKQLEEAKVMIQRDKEAAQAEADIAVRQTEMQQEQSREERKFQLDSQLAREKFEFGRQLKLMDMAMRSQQVGPDGQRTGPSIEKVMEMMRDMPSSGNGMTEVLKALNAPKRVIRDENGDVVGVETVLQ